MIKTLLITYEKLNKDAPVMYIEESGLFTSTPQKVLIHTGEKAERLYKELTGQAEKQGCKVEMQESEEV